jgi:hypothetical protein
LPYNVKLDGIPDFLEGQEEFKAPKHWVIAE